MEIKYNKEKQSKAGYIDNVTEYKRVEVGGKDHIVEVNYLIEYKHIFTSVRISGFTSGIHHHETYKYEGEPKENSYFWEDINQKYELIPEILKLKLQQNRKMTSAKNERLKGVKVGDYCTIEAGVIFGENVVIGDYCKIEAGTEIGDNTVIRNFVELRKDTKIGKECYIDSRVSTSGSCEIGDNVTIRFGAIICREAKIGNGAFIAPQVMTQYSKASGKKVPGIEIGQGAFIGTQAVIAPGVKVGENAVIGTMTYVKENINPNTIHRTKQHPLTSVIIDRE